MQGNHIISSISSSNLKVFMHTYCISLNDVSGEIFSQLLLFVVNYIV